MIIDHFYFDDLYYLFILILFRFTTLKSILLKSFLVSYNFIFDQSKKNETYRAPSILHRVGLTEKIVCSNVVLRFYDFDHNVTDDQPRFLG